VVGYGPRLALAVFTLGTLCLLGASAVAQTSPLVPGGFARPEAFPSVRNPLDFITPEPPVRLSPGVTPPPIERQTGPGEGTVVRVASVAVRGNEAVTTADLRDALDGLAGAAVTLGRIEEARLAILRAYREAGFVFAAVDAGLTPRPDGTADIVFSVVEGFVAEVKLEGDIGPAGTQVLRFLDRLVGVRPVSTADIERALLLASDVPGVTVRGTLRPLQTEPGALQLIAQVERRAVSGFATIDNRGFRNVGPVQWLGVIGLNSVTEFGERTEFSYFGAQNSSQWFVQGSFEAFVGGSGLRLRAYGGGGVTRPTGTLGAIGYFGVTNVAGIVATYPLIRSRPLNVLLTGSFDIFDAEIQTGTIGPRQRASFDQVRTFRAGADLQYLEARLLRFLPAATNIGNVRVHKGVDAFGASRDGDPTTGRNGNETFSFTKVTGEAQRTQPLFSPAENTLLSLQGLFVGQWSNDILPIAEKCFLGGSRVGRGYYAGQVTGDQCWAYGVELQFDVNYEVPITPAWGSNRFTSQFYFFRDFGRTVENAPNDPDRRLSSWGGGVRTVVSDAVQIDLEGVHRNTRQPDGALADRLKETAFFFRVLARF